MKRPNGIFFILILLGVLSFQPVFAGTMGAKIIPVECNPDNCNQTFWETSARALYLQAQYGHDPWITERDIIDTVTGYTQNPLTLSGYGWGGFLESAYHFLPGKTLDLNIYYLDYTSEKSGRLPNGGLRTARQRSKWVTGNVELHQILPIADNNAISVYISANYTYLDKIRNFYRDINGLALNSLTGITGESNGGFRGVGPRWGGHVDYNLPPFLINGLRISLDGAAGILLGYSHAAVTAYTQPILPLVGVITRYSNDFAVVFEFDTRLGISYMHPLYQGTLVFDAGWMAFDYLSAIEDKANAESTDVLYQGFYMGLKWIGNFA